jgi:transcriptional regulator with XRE-family HTH domain
MPKTIKELREERHWSQFALAVKVGVRPETVSRWELGKLQPQGRNLLRLSDIFAVPVEEIDLSSQEQENA